jgi:hypothetical protein
MRHRLLIAGLFLLVVILAVLLAVLIAQRPKPGGSSTGRKDLSASPSSAEPGSTSVDTSAINVRAHNLLLRKGPSFRVYVRWLKGQMQRAHPNVEPSFDDPESFFLFIENGVLRANIGDIANYLNAEGLKNAPLRNVALKGDGDQIHLTGTLHKVIPIPVELVGTLAAVPDNRIRIRVTKLNALKVPLKALLGSLRITVSDLFSTKNLPGVEVNGNDVLFDTQVILPPPHIRGKLTIVRVANPDLEEVYGGGTEDVSRMEQWRNFISLKGGTLDFGKLSMHHVDLIMIDISKDPWFDLDLANYQAQLVNGYTRMTPEAGLQIFMPDLRDIPPNQDNKNISLQWLRNRNLPPPPEVTPKR